MRLLNTICILSIVGPSCALAQACRDIATFDFRNSIIRATGDDRDKRDYGLFNGPGPGGELRLRGGVFLE